MRRHMVDQQELIDALKYNIEYDGAGGRRYFNATGQLHREDGPALISGQGTEHWFKNGVRHREDGPAITWANGGKSWILNGVYVSEYEFNALRRAIQNGRARHI